MIIENLIEHEDGSATMQVQMSNEEMRSLIEIAFRIGLMKGLLMEDSELEQQIKERQNERNQ